MQVMTLPQHIGNVMLFNFIGNVNNVVFKVPQNGSCFLNTFFTLRPLGTMNNGYNTIWACYNSEI